MVKLYGILCFLIFGFANAQPPTVELTSRGYAPIEINIPAAKNEKLVEVSKAWAAAYNKPRTSSGQSEPGADVTDVTENSLTISAFKRNAFRYRNNGEEYQFKVRYSMKLVFNENKYTLTFTTGDIFDENNKLIQYKLTDYFTTDGDIREDYTGLKTSIDNTVNSIILSHHNFILNYK